MNRALETWLDPRYFEEARRQGPGGTPAGPEAVPCIQGRYRRCASQQGNALLYSTVLGLAPEAGPRLAERLLHWQWPDGGWNCDRTPSADSSAFAETLLPMLGLFVFGRARHRPLAVSAARRASGVFLRRRLFRRVSDGRTMNANFLPLHYPTYWHYDVLAGLKALARMDLIRDERCGPALDLLESREGARGGWPAERRFYDLPGEPPRRGTDRVRWGPTGAAPNPWVTADALFVLRAAGRYEPGP